MHGGILVTLLDLAIIAALMASLFVVLQISKGPCVSALLQSVLRTQRRWDGWLARLRSAAGRRLLWWL